MARGVKGSGYALETVRTFGGHRFVLKFRWDTRLGDIFLDGKIVDCMQVHDYDWTTGTLTPSTRKQIALSFEEWLLEYGQSYIDEWQYL